MGQKPSHCHGCILPLMVVMVLGRSEDRIQLANWFCLPASVLTPAASVICANIVNSLTANIKIASL
jgi:hypothetical protein